MQSDSPHAPAPRLPGLEPHRREIAAATRLLEAEGLLGYSGHVSYRAAATDGLLIQPFDVSRAALAPDQVLCCDLDGVLADGPAGARPPSEVHIHAAIYRARADVRAVVHFHPRTATLFTLADGPRLQPMKNHAARWASGIPTYPDPGHVDTPALGRALAATLGDCHAVLMRAHGAVVVAESVPAALVDTVHFEENAEAAWRAAQLGPLVPLTPTEIDAFATRFRRDAHVSKLWRYYVERGVAAGILPTEWFPPSR